MSTYDEFMCSIVGRGAVARLAVDADALRSMLAAYAADWAGVAQADGVEPAEVCASVFAVLGDVCQRLEALGVPGCLEAIGYQPDIVDAETFIAVDAEVSHE